MAKKIYRTAQGKVVDFDAILLQNEEAIAIGNQKVNARGDELGPGGKVVKTRAQVMEEYYKLSSPTAGNAPTSAVAEAPKLTTTLHPDHVGDAKAQPLPENFDAQAAEFEDAIEPQTVASATHHTATTTIRGSLAAAVADTKTITQETQLPLNKRNGVQRF
jgi:hypothetical protein